MICEDGRRSAATFSRRGLRDDVIFWRDKRRGEDGEGKVERGGSSKKKKMNALQAEACRVEGRRIREAGSERKRGTVDEGVTGRKLEASEGKWEGAGDEGIASCHHRFVPRLSHVTCNQTDHGFL